MDNEVDETAHKVSTAKYCRRFLSLYYLSLYYLTDLVAVPTRRLDVIGGRKFDIGRFEHTLQMSI